MRAAALALALLLTPPSPAPAPSAVRAPAPHVTEYSAPVGGPVVVVAGFVAPSTPYGRGHRGVDLRTRPGTVVRSAAAGTVRFAGSVAGRGVVVVEHADGVVTEYEPVIASVPARQQVGRAQLIGRVAPVAHRRCAAGACLHWGARRAGVYLDPLSLLRPLGPVRLVPDP